jgi:hypothetical protein
MNSDGVMLLMSLTPSRTTPKPSSLSEGEQVAGYGRGETFREGFTSSAVMVERGDGKGREAGDSMAEKGCGELCGE